MSEVKVKYSVGTAIKHVKTQGVYIVVLTPDRNMLEETGEPAYGYTNGTMTFQRRQSEIEDENRFVPHVQPTHPIAH